MSPFQNGTSCRLGRIVAFWNLGRIVALRRGVSSFHPKSFNPLLISPHGHFRKCPVRYPVGGLMTESGQKNILANDRVVQTKHGTNKLSHKNCAEENELLATRGRSRNKVIFESTVGLLQ